MVLLRGLRTKMNDGVVVNIKTEDGVTIISFNTPTMLAGPGLDEVSRSISETIVSQEPKSVVVDFSKVKFFSSQTLGILIEMRKKLSERNGEVVICGIDPQLYRVFKITNLDKIFTFFNDISAAEEYFRNNN